MPCLLQTAENESDCTPAPLAMPQETSQSRRQYIPPDVTSPSVPGYNGIIWLNGNFTVHTGCHAGQCGHGLSLASRCNDNRLFIRIIFQLIHINQNVIRQGNISQFRCDGYNIDHASSLNRNFSAKLVCRIDDLLHTIHIGCKCRNNNSCIFMLGKKCYPTFFLPTFRNLYSLNGTSCPSNVTLRELKLGIIVAVARLSEGLSVTVTCADIPFPVTFMERRVMPFLSVSIFNPVGVPSTVIPPTPLGPPPIRMRVLYVVCAHVKNSNTNERSRLNIT